MLKFFVGLILGVVLTFVTLLLIPDSAVNDTPADGLAIASDAEASPANAANSSVQQQHGLSPSELTTSDDSKAVVATVVATSARAVPADNPVVQVNNIEPGSGPNTVNPVIANESQSADTNPKVQSANTTLTTVNGPPIKLSDAHQQYLAKNREEEPPPTTMHGLHDRIESEARDNDWSYYIEQQLRNFFGAATVNVGIDTIHVECRSTLCEIQAIGYNEIAASQWQQIFQQMRDQAWASEFSGSNLYSTDQDNKIIMFAFLIRKTGNG